MPETDEWMMGTQWTDAEMRILQARQEIYIASGLDVRFEPLPINTAPLVEGLTPRRLAFGLPMFCFKPCGSTEQECLSELDEKLPPGVTVEAMANGRPV